MFEKYFAVFAINVIEYVLLLDQVYIYWVISVISIFTVLSNIVFRLDYIWE